MDKALLKIVTDITSNNYRVLWGSGAGRGTFIIERMADSATSLRFTGLEAQEYFKQLKYTWAKDRNAFDAMCGKWDYSI